MFPLSIVSASHRCCRGLPLTHHLRYAVQDTIFAAGTPCLIRWTGRFFRGRSFLFDGYWSIGVALATLSFCWVVHHWSFLPNTPAPFLSRLCRHHNHCPTYLLPYSLAAVLIIRFHILRCCRYLPLLLPLVSEYIILVNLHLFLPYPSLVVIYLQCISTHLHHLRRPRITDAHNPHFAQNCARFDPPRRYATACFRNYPPPPHFSTAQENVANNWCLM